MFNIDNTVLHENQPTKRVKSYFFFFFLSKTYIRVQGRKT